ncbi:hypothetical protein XA68_10054 [Ophiocordyceps unilateralis]|uniref:Uncharacterized protein n=1 Tax=Ophiocordyceps unilateralis TaxID=268505 RepID=A0A2A9PTX9_OPHUN|nr:hypothetical protein XA68_10054 [Ophiocordyceps unilateralis]
MKTSGASALFASLALAGLCVAMPSPTPTAVPLLVRRGEDELTVSEEDYTTVAPTAPWVTVDDEGQPAMTVTPSINTISGTTTVEHGAPHDLTASVYTWITWGAITTSTGTPPNPTAVDGKTGQGAFSRCFNRDDQELAPFCRPLANSTLLTGTTYYVTWDPDFYKNAASDNTTTLEVAVRLDFLNQSSNEWAKLDTYDRVPAKWGFWPLRLRTEHLKGQRYNNATITLVVSPRGGDERNKSVALPVTLTSLGVDDMPPPRVPKGSTLLIALPVSLASFFLVLIGLYLWHRQTRTINLGNIMGRSRHGYNGRRHRRHRFLASARHRQQQQQQQQQQPHPQEEPRVPLNTVATEFRDLPSPTEDPDVVGGLQREKMKLYGAKGPRR